MAPFPPRSTSTRYPGNPTDFLWSLGALLLAMDSWISDDKPPATRWGGRLPQIEVPLATCTPWNFRREDIGAPHELANFRGAYLPFAVVEAERRRSGDPRPSLEERYTNRDENLGRYARASKDLAKDGFLLPRDLSVMLSPAGEFWHVAVQNPATAEAARQ